MKYCIIILVEPICLHTNASFNQYKYFFFFVLLGSLGCGVVQFFRDSPYHLLVGQASFGNDDFDARMERVS